jgi:hypothetical protein
MSVAVSTTIPLYGGVSCGRLKISYTKCRLFTKAQFTKIGKLYMVYIGFWLEPERFSFTVGFH